MKKRIALLLMVAITATLLGCSTQKKKDVPMQDTLIQNENEDSTMTNTEDYSLRDFFSKHNMKIGTCLTPNMTKLKSDLLLSQFNSVTLENSMKPDYILSKSKSQETGEIVVEFNNDMITMLDWAKSNHMAVRGHTLIWYSQTPSWIFYEDFDTNKGLADRDSMLSRMESMISQVFNKLDEAGYLELFYAYDIVNEAWMEDGSMRDCKWRETIGDDYLWYAFYYADKYAPESVDLYYNDYNEQFKASTLVSFVETLVDTDGRSLIDGIGLQAHLYTKDSIDKYLKTLDTLSATGLKLQITELDVCLGAYQEVLDPTDENLRLQGQFYYSLLKGILERVDAGTLKMDALTFWGYQDGYSWRKEGSPLLYDAGDQPKYSYYGVLQMKEQAGY